MNVKDNNMKTDEFCRVCKFYDGHCMMGELVLTHCELFIPSDRSVILNFISLIKDRHECGDIDSCDDLVWFLDKYIEA